MVYGWSSLLHLSTFVDEVNALSVGFPRRVGLPSSGSSPRLAASFLKNIPYDELTIEQYSALLELTNMATSSIRLLRRQHLHSFPQPVFSSCCSQSRTLSTLSARQNAASPQSSNANANAPSTSTPSKADSLDPRWLTLIKRRIGKCLMFGLKPLQVAEAGRILQQLARDWRELIAGSEGFLTGKTRRALFCHNVVWGEMVSLRFLSSCD